MCGIFGSVGVTLGNANIVAALTALRHRGPDGWGVWTTDPDSPEGTAIWPADPDRPWPCNEGQFPILESPREVLLANTRLGLCGHGPHSRQPVSAIGRGAITFNGEIYNYRSLRTGLERDGFQFRSDSDTEVLLAGFLRWGPAVVHRLDGPFAFAIWDSANRRLFGARDRFGEKPFYFTHESASRKFAFASTPRALFAAGLASGAVSDSIAAGYLFARTPPSGDETFFDDMRRLPQGCSFEYIPDTSQLHIAEFSSSSFEVDPTATADPNHLRTILIEGMELRRQANSPVALCLSGGVDSGNLAASARSRLTCFSLINTVDSQPIGENAFPDEREQVKSIEVALPNLSIAFLPIGNEITFANFQRFVSDHDEPPLNSGSFVQWLLMKKIAETGTRVVITGQGADELFWGYPWYIPTYSRDHHWDRVWRDDFGGRLAAGSAAVNMADIDQLRRQELFRTRLPQHLRDDDSNSMAHGIETRNPYLGRHVVDIALSLPASECFQQRTTKYPVRAAFSSTLPADVAWGKTKRGLYIDCTSQWSDQLLVEGRRALEQSAVLARIADPRQLRDDLTQGRMSSGMLWRLVALASAEAAASSRAGR